jgi:MipA family protein
LPWPAQSWSAEQEGEYDPNGTHWRLGIGGGLLQKAYAGVDGEGIPLPLLIFENRWISLPGPGIDFKLPLDGPVSFALRAEYSSDGYKASDSSALAGMTKRKGSFWYGTTSAWHNDIANVSAEWLTDGSDISDGSDSLVSTLVGDSS